MIRLYDTNYTNGLHLTSNGLVILQPFKCIETKSEEEWKLDVEVDDSYVIEKNQVIVVKTKEALYQPFRVGNVTLDKHTYSFTAYHVAYDLENYRIQSLTITNQGGSAFMNSLLGASLPANPFTPLSDIVATQSAVFENVSVLEALIEARNLFGGHLVFDNYNVKLQASIGSNRGVVIQEGKNLQGLSKSENWDNVVTTIIPTCGDRVYSAINADVSYDIPYVKTVAFDSDEEGESAIQTDVIAQATAYLNINKYPRVNYVVKSDIVQLVQIGDTVTVKSDYTIGTTVMAYTYDVVTERVLSVEFGNYRPTIKSVFSGYAKLEDVKKNNATVNQIILDQTNIINGLYQSGYVVVNDNEIYIVDTLPKENAVNVLRMNLGGIGFSSNGISGPFGSAWTLDGKFNADYIQAGTINASLINGTAIDISANTSITSKVSTTTYTSGLATKEDNIIKQSTAPTHAVGKLWLDTSATPNILKRSDGANWIKSTPTTASEVGAYSSADGSTLAGRVATAESSITQNATDITLKVSTTDYNGNEITSRINQTATTISIEANKININGVVSANTYFKINTNGSMEAKAGKIADWNITTDRIYGGTSSDYVGMSTGILSSSEYYAFWAGNSTPASAPFGVTRTGKLYATSGEVGAFKLSTDRMYAGASTTYVGISPSVSGYSFWAGNPTPSLAPFSVTNVGKVNLQNVTIGDLGITSGGLGNSYGEIWFSSSQSRLKLSNGWINAITGTWTLWNVDFVPYSTNQALGISSKPWARVHALGGVITSSDKRLKDNIQPIENGVDLILNVKPVEYTMEHDKRKHFGFIAQEVQEVMTQTVGDFGGFIDPTVKPDWDTSDPTENEKPHYLSLRYEEFIAPMVQTIQHLAKRISALEGK